MKGGLAVALLDRLSCEAVLYSRGGGGLRRSARLTAALRLSGGRPMSGSDAGRAVRELLAGARARGAERVVLAARSSLRSAAGRRWLGRLRREAGVEVEPLDAARESRYAFLGALRTAPVAAGLAFVVEPDALHLARFQGRVLAATARVDLGAAEVLGLAGRLGAEAAVRRLSRRVRAALRASGIGLARGEELVGSGLVRGRRAPAALARALLALAVLQAVSATSFVRSSGGVAEGLAAAELGLALPPTRSGPGPAAARAG